MQEWLAELFGLVVTDAKKWEEASKGHTTDPTPQNTSGTIGTVCEFPTFEVKVEHNGISWAVHTLNLEAWMAWILYTVKAFKGEDPSVLLRDSCLPGCVFVQGGIHSQRTSREAFNNAVCSQVSHVYHGTW